MTKLRVAVIYGGRSPEHEVSIITAVQAMAALPDQFEVIPLYVTKTGRILTGPQLFSLDSYRDLPLLTRLAESVRLPTTPATLVLTPAKAPLFGKSRLRPFDVLFPCFHGGVGEGGWIQGLAEYYQIPLVGTGLTGAALGMDKVAMKHAFAAANLPQAPYLWFHRHTWHSQPQKVIKQIKSALKFPLFVKPSRGGSSIGTTRVLTIRALKESLDLAAALDTRLVVEQAVEPAREINLSVMGNAGGELEYSVCEEVFHEGSEFLNFQDKYLSGGKIQGMAAAKRQIPAHLSPSTVQELQNYAGTIFHLLDCAGLVRIDFLLQGKQIFVIEINTIPGSLSFYLWEKSGYPYPQLLAHLIKLGLAKYATDQQTQTEFNSPILQSSSLGSKLTPARRSQEVPAETS